MKKPSRFDLGIVITFIFEGTVIKKSALCSFHYIFNRNYDFLMLKGFPYKIYAFYITIIHIISVYNMPTILSVLILEKTTLL